MQLRCLKPVKCQRFVLTYVMSHCPSQHWPCRRKVPAQVLHGRVTARLCCGENHYQTVPTAGARSIIEIADSELTSATSQLAVDTAVG